jgi:N-acetylglucosamine-6-phosphate deacetylase
MNMNKYFYYLLLLIFLVHAQTVQSQSDKQRIEGWLYLDHTAVSVEIADGRIQSITRLKEVPSNFPTVYIAPGFIDNQVNGYAGVSFAFGGSDLTAEGVIKATQTLWKEGVTTYLPTLTTNHRDILIKNFGVLHKAMNMEELSGSIPGFHLEGPFISPEDGFRGAHPAEFVKLPDLDEFLSYNEAAGGKILQVTLAPELDGALELIEYCTGKGIVVGLGHHNASAEVILAAIDRGAGIATHLGNGMANTVNRHRNPFWPQLSDDRLMISIIGDGFHLLPEQIRTFWKVKGTDNTIITSDVTSFAGLPPGEFTTSEGVTIELTADGMLRYPAQNVLYGSAAPITKGVGHVMKVTGCSLADAVHMASTNPARLYGLSDRGEIRPGLRADLVLFTIEDFKIQVQSTIVEGNTVFSKK